MPRLRCPRVIHVLSVVMFTVGLSATLRAQTPPRPAVDVRQIPAMWRQVTPADFNGDARAGNSLTGHTSTDGVTWTLLGTTTVAMNDNVLIGLPVTSHNNATLATAVFDDVALRR